MRRIESPGDVGPIQAAGKALLLLTAPGCADSPVVRERMVKVGGRNSSVLLASADTSKVPGLAKVLGITETPTVVLYRRGQRIADLTGRVTAQQLQELVDSVMW